MKTWLIVGSSRTAVAGYKRAVAEQNPDIIATSNSGIQIVPDPDYCAR